MQFFSASLAEVRAVKDTDWNTFDPEITNKSVMEKNMINVTYVKEYSTQFVFIVLVTTGTFLKRMTGGTVIRLRY